MTRCQPANLQHLHADLLWQIDIMLRDKLLSTKSPPFSARQRLKSTTNGQERTALFNIILDGLQSSPSVDRVVVIRFYLTLWVSSAKVSSGSAPLCTNLASNLW